MARRSPDVRDDAPGGRTVNGARPSPDDELAGEDGLRGGAVASGARWMAGGQIALQVTKLVVSVFIARLLDPGDLGLFTLTLVVTDLLERALAVGTSAALVQRRTVTHGLVSSVFWFNVGVGVLTLAFLVVGADPLAALLGNDDAAPVLRGVGVAFVLLALGQAQRAVLRRSLAFAALAKADYVNSLVQGVVSVVLALQGAGVWSLVIGLLAGKAVSNVVIWRASGWRPSRWFRWQEVRSLSRFSGNLSVFQFFTYFSEAGDKFLVGRLFGSAALGFYGYGYRLLLNPVNAVLSVSRQVLFPAFSRIQDDDEAIAAGWVRSVAPAALLLFPIAIGLAVVTDPFVRVVLGERWLDAAPIIAIFGPIAAIQSVSTTTSVLYQAKGRTDLQLWWGLPAGLLMLLAYVIGSRWDAVGVAWAFLLGTAVLAVPGLAIPFRLVGLRAGTYLAALAPIALATAVMAGAALATRLVLEAGEAEPAVVLAGAVAIGGLAYAGALAALRPPALGDVLLLVRPSRPVADDDNAALDS